MDQGDPGDPIIRRRILRSGEADHQVMHPDQDEVRVADIEMLAFAYDDPNRAEGLLAESGLNVAGREHGRHLCAIAR
jgi:hypothetical protein